MSVLNFKTMECFVQIAQTSLENNIKWGYAKADSTSMQLYHHHIADVILIALNNIFRNNLQ